MIYQEFLSLLDPATPGLNNENKRKIWDYFSLLYEENQKQNLTGYKNIEEYLVYHLQDTLKQLGTVDIQGGVLTDVGSGAGIPGILIKIMRPDLKVMLMESMKKKGIFLRKAIDHLELANVEVIIARAEQTAHDERYREQSDYVTARALAPLSQALELTAGFVKVGGKLFLPRGIDETNENHEKSVLETLNLQLEREEYYSLRGREKQYRLAVYKKIKNTPEKYPRNPGQIRKRPL
ncbi:MAG: 16S rRNA (guanine(527)-N(7))-methyltransferase RsmG [bacterium]|jgi:16S rRNA (guanine527-N7)-methyltransferase